MSFIYRNVIRAADKLVPAGLQPTWNHAAGIGHTAEVDIEKLPDAIPRGNFQSVEFSEEPTLIAVDLETTDLRPKTIFFWAPTMKWCLVIAGIGDMARPAEKLSLTQSTALAATGLIWSRYSLVITPKNWNLFCVNIFVAATGLYQLNRIYKRQKNNSYQKELKEVESHHHVK